MGYQNDKPSMFDDMAKHISDTVLLDIQEQLFDSWISGHIDEGRLLLIMKWQVCALMNPSKNNLMNTGRWNLERNTT